MSAITFTASQVRYVNKSFWRNPARAVFTFGLPLMFLVIFTTLAQGAHLQVGARTIEDSTYYVAAMAAFGVMMACYHNLTHTLTFQRESGILKRLDGSPLPKQSFIASRITHAAMVGVLLVVITAAFGRLFYSATIPTDMALIQFLLVLVVGTATFSALALAVTAVIPNADAATPIVSGTLLPLAFLSGIFIPFGDSTPAWLLWIGRIFPVMHFQRGMMAAFVGTPFDWTDVIAVAAWGVAAVLFAVRFFAWEPRAG
jgi:ABC-2 type transport system permease protein